MITKQVANATFQKYNETLLLVLVTVKNTLPLRGCLSQGACRGAPVAGRSLRCTCRAARPAGHSSRPGHLWLRASTHRIRCAGVGFVGSVHETPQRTPPHSPAQTFDACFRRHCVLTIMTILLLFVSLSAACRNFRTCKLMRRIPVLRSPISDLDMEVRIVASF